MESNSPSPKSAGAFFDVHGKLKANVHGAIRHPDVLTILSEPAPAPSSRLVSVTIKIADNGGGQRAPQGMPDSGPALDLTDNAFKSAVEALGGMGKAKKAAAALLEDAPKLAMAVGGIIGGDSFSNKPRGPRHPILDAPVSKVASRDPVCRAVVRLQRARVLAAAHAMAIGNAEYEQARRAARPSSALVDSARRSSVQPSSAAPPAPAPAPSPPAPRPNLLGYDNPELDATIGKHLFGGKNYAGGGVKRPGSPSSRPATASGAIGSVTLTREQLATMRELAKIDAKQATLRRARSKSPGPFDEDELAATFGADPYASTRSDSRSPSPSPRPGHGHGGVSPSRTASRPVSALTYNRTQRPASTALLRPSTAATFASRATVRGPGGLPPGVPPLPRAVYTSASRVASAAIRRGRAPTAAELELGRQTWAVEESKKADGVRERLQAMETARTEELRELAGKEARMKDRTAFLVQQRGWMTVVALTQSLLGIRMRLADEKAARALAAKKSRCAIRIGKWVRKQMILKEVKALASKRRIVMATVGRWIRRRKTRKLVAAARIVRAFLTQAVDLSTQIKTIMQYRTYTRSVRTVAKFLLGVKTRRKAQLRMTIMLWEEAEAAGREDLATAISHVYRHGLGNAAPPVVAIMRTLRITTAAAAIARAQSIIEAATRWQRVPEEPAKAKKVPAKGKGTAAGKGTGASAVAKGKSPPPTNRAQPLPTAASTAGAPNPLLAAASVGYTGDTAGDLAVKQSGHALQGMLGAGSDTGVYNKYAHDSEKGRHRSSSVDAIMTCLLPVPDHERDGAIARFLLYRRQERWDEVQGYRKKFKALQLHLQTQRRNLEMVQRLAYKGPASLFAFDESEYTALLPKPPKPFRNLPTRADVSALVESCQGDWFRRTGHVWAAEEAGLVQSAAASAAAAKKKGALDSDDHKLEQAMRAGHGATAKTGAQTAAKGVPQTARGRR